MLRCTSTVAGLLVLGALIPHGDAAAQRSRREPDELRSRVDTTFAFSRAGVVDLTLMSGDIVVTAASGNEARVRAYSERGRIRMSASSSRLTLEIESDRGRTGDSRYEVSVPVGVRLILRSMSGDISSRGVRGPIEVHTMSGDVVVQDATGRISLESISGDVRASRLEGDVRITSVSGDVVLEDVKGDIRAESTSGDVTVRNATTRSVYATTVSGEVAYQGSLDASGRYEFRSHSGSVRLDLPQSISARFDAETFSGSLDSDFPVTLQPGERVSRRPRRFEFTVGGGDARVSVQTFSGDILLKRGSRTNR